MAFLGMGLAQETRVSAAIQEGDCEDLRDGVTFLTPPVIATGPQRGNAAALPAVSSFTTVPVSLTALVNTDHAIVIESAVPEHVVACGDLGGWLTEAGALVIGLQPVQDSGIAGIVYLRPSADPAQTDISLFVTDASSDARTGLPVVAATPSAEAPVGGPAAATGVVVVAVGDIACGQDSPLAAPCASYSVARLAVALVLQRHLASPDVKPG